MSKKIAGMMVDRRTTLHSILDSWIRTNIHVAEAWDGIDAPWLYKERASLSIFSGAIWQAGGIAFEEFSEEKLYAGRRGSRRKPYSGRCDIYFQIRSKDFVAEAKHDWSGATNNASDPVPRISKQLHRAKMDAGALVPNGHYRLALVFVVPYFTSKYLGDEVGMIERWIVKIREIECFAKAWVFPTVCRQLQGDDGEYFPGAALFIEKVSRDISRFNQ